MGKIVAYVICTIFLIIGVKGSIECTIANKSCKQALYRMLYYFSILVTFLVLIINLDRVMNVVMMISSRLAIENIKSTVVNISALLILFFSIQFIMFKILKKIFSLFFCSEDDEEKRYKVKPYSIMVSTAIGIIKGVIVVLILFIGVITYNNSLGSKFYVSLFNNIKVYDQLNSFITSEKTNYVYTGEIANNNNILVYYNGVTLDEGIQSNQEIDNKAEEIVQYASTDREKAKKIYYWVGSNIEYDVNKAIVALKDNSRIESGAITAWKERKGICFDYACLYVAMAKDVGLKVRLVTGKAFDGQEYGSHAWNQVYLADEGKWIDIDPTFYLAGDYFDSDSFYDDHIFEGVAGEW